MASPPVATQQETVDGLLEKSGRPSVPLRRVFVQQGRRKELKAGPLATFVRKHDSRGLDLYLLTVALASAYPFAAVQPSGVWARALGLRGASRRAAVSRSWKRLEEMHLLSRSRKGRLAEVTLLREDGSGDPYLSLGQKGDAYFQIPLVYFRDGWYKQMDLPAKAILLIALSLVGENRDEFYLPSAWVSRWYGLSADTAERGLTKLRELGLIDREIHFKAAPLTDQGWTKEYTYRLKVPFARSGTPRGRAAVQPKEVRLEVV